MSIIIEHAHRYAKANDLVIIEPRPDVLQLDLDDRFAGQQYMWQLSILKQFHKIVSTHETASKGGNTHVYIKLGASITIQEAIAIQSCLGSDLRRELLTLRNVADGRDLPMFLFETQTAAASIPSEFKPDMEAAEVAA